MRTNDQVFDALHEGGTLREGVDISSESRSKEPSLNMKLLHEMAKPLNAAIRRAAVDAKRLGKLRAIAHY